MTRLLSGLLVVTSLVLAMAAPGWAASLPELGVLALELVNRERTQRGLTALKPDPILARAAQSHADDMLRRRYFDHVSPEGGTALDRFIAAGGSRWLEVGENISRCTGCSAPPGAADVRKAQAGWMDSPPHRANILHPHMTHFGFGMAIDADGRQYGVQTFAGPGAAPGGGAGDIALGREAQRALALDLVNRERRRSGLEPMSASDGLDVAARSMAEALTRAVGEPRLRSQDVLGAVPAADRGHWRELAAAAVACGGCGVAPTKADIAYFRDRWAEGGGGHIRDPRYSHFGFALVADGQGRKVAVAVFGRRG